MELAQIDLCNSLNFWVKVPIIYFFEDYKDFKDLNQSDIQEEDLNYSFLSRTFSSLSKSQKTKKFFKY